MSENIEPPTREASLSALDQAYVQFLEAFRDVPDEALSYVPAGDEYALGILPEHLCDPLWKYSSQLDAMVRADFSQIDLSLDNIYEEAQARRHADLAAWRPLSAERGAMLARLKTAHQHAHSRLAALDDVTFTRTAPIVYTAGSEPYPTAARDIAGWLIDHYDEHTAQTRELLVRWRADAQTQAW
ncbi:MAG TPA: DinB family protein [Ktedonobacterales bacterium]|nr:DinB family protein [Ktedonobacterales bacterium]